MRMDEVACVGGTQDRERDTECGDGPEWNDLFSQVAAPGLTPGPLAIQVVRRNGRHQVAEQRGANFVRNNAKPVDNGDDDDRRHARRHRDQGVALDRVLAESSKDNLSSILRRERRST